ncbi:36443_t:CDS:2, partial [Gigaspora margarita]
DYCKEEVEQIKAIPVPEDNKKKSIKNFVAQSNINEVIFMFDRWTNICKEHIWEVVLLTTSGQPIVWKAYNISAKQLKTENII